MLLNSNSLRDYTAAEEDDNPLSLFEIIFELEVEPKKDMAIKVIYKKDFYHAHDFINFKRDFIIYK